MKYILKAIPVLIMLIFISSCSQSPSDKYLVMEIDLSNPKEKLPLSSFTDSVRSYRLELPSPYFWGIVNEMVMVDSLLFLVDKKQSIIFVFHRDGRFSHTIGQRGEGPQEYRNVTSFFIGESNAFICDMGSRKIYYYRFDGKYMKTLSFPYSLVFDNIAALPNGDFLCHRLGQDDNCRGLRIMNDQGEKVQTLLTSGANYPYIHSDWNTLYSGRKGYIEIYDPPTGGYYIWDIEHRILKQTMQQKTNMKMLADFNGMENAMRIKEEYAYSQFTIHGDVQVFSIWMLPYANKMACSVYSKLDRKATVFTQPKMDYPGYKQMGKPISSNVPNTLVTITTDETPASYFPAQYQQADINERIAILNFISLKK